MCHTIQKNSLASPSTYQDITSAPHSHSFSAQLTSLAPNYPLLLRNVSFPGTYRQTTVKILLNHSDSTEGLSKAFFFQESKVSKP